MNTFEQSLDLQPAAPQGFPAGWPIAFAPQIAAQASNGVPALLGSQVCSGPPCFGRDHGHHRGRQDVEGLLVWVQPAGGPQLGASAPPGEPAIPASDASPHSFAVAALQYDSRF